MGQLVLRRLSFVVELNVRSVHHNVQDAKGQGTCIAHFPTH